MKFWVYALAAVLALSGLNAEAAKRLGGGKSIGKQSSNVTQREASPPPPAAPAQNAATAAPRPAPVAPPPAAQPRRPWGAMLGGLAAGLGLAWLAHSMGMGEGFGQILMFALLAFGVVVLVRWLFRARQNPAAGPAAPFAFQGTGAAAMPVSPSYRPENVGNDASARPWERSTLGASDSVSAPTGSMIGSNLNAPPVWGIPAGFDTDGFLQSARSSFVSLQAAWDRADIPALRAMMTTAMLAEIQAQLSEREAQTGSPFHQTEVLAVDARLLGIETTADEYVASVEFSGMIRDEPSAGPGPFREVWNMTRTRTGTDGWLVAGVQALQ